MVQISLRMDRYANTSLNNSYWMAVFTKATGMKLVNGMDAAQVCEEMATTTLETGDTISKLGEVALCTATEMFMREPSKMASITAMAQSRSQISKT